MISLERVSRVREWHPRQILHWTLQSASRSLCGTRHQHDEDFVIAEDLAGIFGVADGVGGNYGGAEASEFVCSVLAEELLETNTDCHFGLGAAKSAFRHAIDVAMDGMNQMVVECSDLDHMSTTLAVGWVVRGRLFYAHAGDSRVYLYRDGELIRLTKDHSFAEAMRQSKEMTDEDIASHPYRNVITRCIGPASDDNRLDVASLWLRPRDRIIFLTDGITDVIDDESILGLATCHPERQELCDALVHTAQFSGSRDDVSCVVVDCDTDEPEEAKLEPQWWEFKWLR